MTSGDVFFGDPSAYVRWLAKQAVMGRAAVTFDLDDAWKAARENGPDRVPPAEDSAEDGA